MKAVLARRAARGAAMLLAASSLAGCYYMQAARGQLDVMQRSEPIAEVVDTPDTPAELERDFVVWNVFAAPEFSTQPKEWCFPIAGCVAYRGYFSEAAARRKADSLRADRLDVAVSGVPAYSTLGRFDDPVLNTMLRWEDVDLIATMFHELAHQVLYVKGDSAFNESFATVVEEAGIERWLRAQGDPDEYAAYRQRREFRETIVAEVGAAKAELDRLYRMRLAATELRRRKTARLEKLADGLRAAFENSGRSVPDWVNADLNNARLASMALYRGRVPELRELLEACGGDLACFYASAEDLARP